MIKSQDRSGWIGASDCTFVMGNWDTVSFGAWWAEKSGLTQRNIHTKAMTVGTNYEHRILDFIGVQKRDRQIRKRWLRLRVNLDGETRTTIKEVKTHKGKFKITKGYWQQIQVQMFAARKRAEFVAYHLDDEDYDNFFNEIEPDRISYYPVKYDPAWIDEEYLPRLRYLAHCIRRKKTPTMDEFNNKWRNKLCCSRVVIRLWYRVRSVVMRKFGQHQTEQK